MWESVVLISLLALIVSFIGLIVFAVKRNPIWKKCIMALGASFILLIVGVVNMPPGEPQQASNTPKQETQVSTPSANQKEEVPIAEEANTPAAPDPPISSGPQEKPTPQENELYNIGYTPNDFRAIFNNKSRELDAGFALPRLNVEKGAVQDGFRHSLTNNLVIMGTVHKKDGMVRSVSVLGSGDGTIESGANIILAMVVLISTINPELNPDQRGEILKNLGVFDNKTDIMDLNKETTKHGIRYSIVSSEMFGIIFSASNVNDI